MQAHIGLIEGIGYEVDRIRSTTGGDTGVHVVVLRDAGRQLLINGRLLSFCDTETAQQYARKDFVLVDDLLSTSKTYQTANANIANYARAVTSHYKQSVPYPAKLDPVPVGVTTKFGDLLDNGYSIKDAALGYLAPFAGDSACPSLIICQAILEKKCCDSPTTSDMHSAAQRFIRMEEAIKNTELSLTESHYCKMGILGDLITSPLVSASCSHQLAFALSDPFLPDNFEGINRYYTQASDAVKAFSQAHAHAPIEYSEYTSHIGMGR